MHVCLWEIFTRICFALLLSSCVVHTHTSTNCGKQTEICLLCVWPKNWFTTCQLSSQMVCFVQLRHSTIHYLCIKFHCDCMCVWALAIDKLLDHRISHSMAVWMAMPFASKYVSPPWLLLLSSSSSSSTLSSSSLKFLSRFDTLCTQHLLRVRLHY